MGQSFTVSWSAITVARIVLNPQDRPPGQGEETVLSTATQRLTLHIDLLPSPIHISPMDFDISHLLEHWEYQPGQVVVRRFKAKDGIEKLQLRVDLGLLQMNAEGRPDGKRPYGYLSLFEYYQARLYKHLAAHEGSDDGFRLKAEDCGKLQLEALQYHHRYICLLQLEDYAGVIRDAE